MQSLLPASTGWPTRSATAHVDAEVGKGDVEVEVAAAAAAVPRPSTIRSRLWSQSKSLWSAVRRRDILLPAAFVFLWQVQPGGREGRVC